VLCAYREPAKYVATLRHLQQQQQQQQQGSDSSSRAEASHQKPLLLLTDLHAGHFAASGASSKLQERAVKVAFLLHNLDCSAVTS
jgi:protease II